MRRIWGRQRRQSVGSSYSTQSVAARSRIYVLTHFEIPMTNEQNIAFPNIIFGMTQADVTIRRGQTVSVAANALISVSH